MKNFLHSLSQRKWLTGASFLLALISVFFTVIGLGLHSLGVMHFTLTFTNPLERPQQLPSIRDQNTQELGKGITEFGMDNKLLSQLYNQAAGLAKGKYKDAELNQFTIDVFPYVRYGNVFTIYFCFYSASSDRSCWYISYEGGIVKPSFYSPDIPAKSDYERLTFNDLPWVSNPDWLEFPAKASQKIGPLTPIENTYYHISSDAYTGKWHITFYDGLSGNNYSYYWDGRDIQIETGGS